MRIKLVSLAVTARCLDSAFVKARLVTSLAALRCRRVIFVVTLSLARVGFFCVSSLPGAGELGCNFDFGFSGGAVILIFGFGGAGSV